MSVFKNIIRQVYYFGFRYKCPFCNSHLKTFIPHGLEFKVLTEKKIVGGYRRTEGKCPVCFRTDRERLLYRYIFHSGKIDLQNANILHVAPEKGIEKQIRAVIKKKNISYTTGDKFEEGYDYKDCHELDITKTHYADNTFDLLICNHVLEHIQNDTDAMREIYRILKPGGKAILQVPISLVLKETYEAASITEPKMREEQFGQFDHVRLYGQDYPKRLESCGFKVVVDDPVQLFGAGLIRKEGINSEEKVFVAIKP